VPVLAVPSLARSESGAAGVRTILATTDGSDYADAVAPFAAELAAACGSSVVLLELTSGAASESRAADQQADAEKHLIKLAELFEKSAVPVQRVVAQGNPISGILDQVKRRNVDLIAMSTHGGAPRCEAVVGSVTQAILRQSGIPVLMTRTCPAPRRPGDRRKAAKVRRR
jgi:nucleotide-binding universal stress UspA family protein